MRRRGSRVTITNPHGFSAPGYLELLTGQAQPDVTSNDPIRYAHETVLEHARERLGLPPERVAVFTSWDNFRFYAASREGAFFVNAGYDSLPAALRTAGDAGPGAARDAGRWPSGRAAGSTPSPVPWPWPTSAAPTRGSCTSP